MSDAWKQSLESRLSAWRDEGLTRELRTIAGKGPRVTIDGRLVLSFASNDYLGLAGDERLLNAASQAMRADGAGASASTLITGHKTIHAELERDLAAFKQAESALVFASGYQAAVATLVALASAEDTILLDRLAHASLIDGAQLSGARVRIFKHNNMDDLRDLLKKEAGRRCIIAVESLYSMDGDLAPLPQLSDIAASSGALLLVDEAHATGVMGPNGRGALEPHAVDGRLPPHIIAMGTLSKALGSQGGYICAPKFITDTIIHAGRAYLFSTGLSPACAGAAREALRIIAAEPERRERLNQIEERLRDELQALGMDVVPSVGPIVPVLMGDEESASTWSRRLLDAGLLVPAIRFPTVKKGHARLRISLSAAHSVEDVEQLIAGFGIKT